MKTVTNPVKTEIEITSSQANVRFDVKEQTTEVMGLKSNVKGPSAEWEWNLKEDKVNKVKTINSQSTDTQYPSAKCVYDAIQNIPSSQQIQSDWDQTDTEAVDFIKNKPNLATVATSGSYTDLSNKPSLATVATSGDYDDLTNKPTIPASPVQSNWNESDTSSLAYIQNKPSLSTVATSGSYTDLSNTPDLTLKQDKANMTQTVSSSSLSTEYPSAIAVYNYIQSLDGSQIAY